MRMSHLYLPTVMTGFLMLTASVAHAQVSTQGTPEVVHVEAKNASMDEVLGALRDGYGLTYRSNIPLTRQVSGTFDGPLPQVLARLLDGTNYVLTTSGNTVHVVIVSAAGSQQVPGPQSAMPFPMPATKASPAPQVPVGIVFPPPGPPVESARKN